MNCETFFNTKSSTWFQNVSKVFFFHFFWYILKISTVLSCESFHPHLPRCALLACPKRDPSGHQVSQRLPDAGQFSQARRFRQHQKDKYRWVRIDWHRADSWEDWRRNDGRGYRRWRRSREGRYTVLPCARALARQALDEGIGYLGAGRGPLRNDRLEVPLPGIEHRRAGGKSSDNEVQSDPSGCHQRFQYDHKAMLAKEARKQSQYWRNNLLRRFPEQSKGQQDHLARASEQAKVATENLNKKTIRWGRA